MGTFDDLVPTSAPATAGNFADLIPASEKPDLINPTNPNQGFSLPKYKKTYKRPSEGYDPRIPAKDWPQEEVNIPWSDSDKAVAASGVDITTGSPYGLRTLVDTANDEEEKIRTINRYYGAAGVHKGQARVGPVSGEMEYISPDTGRYTLLNPRSANLQTPTVPNLATQGLTGAGLIAGTLTGGLPGGAVGSLAGRWTAQLGKQIVTDILGNSTRDTGKQIRNMAVPAGEEGLTNLVAGGATLAASKIGPYIIYGNIGKDVFKRTEAPAIIEKARQAQESLADYYKLSASGNFKPDVAQLSNDPAAHLAMQKTGLGSEFTQIAYGRRQDANMSDLQQTFKKVTDAYKSPENPPMGSGQAIADWQKQLQNAQQGQEELHKSALEGQARQAVGGLPSTDKNEVVTRTTEMVNLVKEGDKDAVDKAYGDLAVKLGVPSQVAYEKGSDRLMQPQVPTVPFTLSKVGKTKLETVVNEAVRAGDVDSNMMGSRLHAIPDGFLKTGENGKLAIDDSPKDLYWVIQEIQRMRTGQRAAAFRSKGMMDPDQLVQGHVEDALSKDVEDYLMRRGDPHVMSLWDTAQNQAKTYASKWRNTILGEASKKSDGFTTPTYNQGVSQALLSNNREANQELSAILDGDPLAKDEVRQMLFGIYKNHYTIDGMPTRNLHDKFLTDIKEPLRSFFTPEESLKLGNLGSLGDLVDTQTAKVARFQQAWKAMPFGNLPANSLAISRAAFGSSAKLNGLGSFLSMNNPTLLKQLQSDTAQQIADKVVGSQGTKFNLSQLDAILSETKYPNVRDIMPHEYMANLKTIANAAHIASRVPEEYVKDPSLLKYAVRGVIGYFGPEARWYHFLSKFREKSSADLVYNALANPEDMSKFMQAKEYTLAKARTAGVLSTLGANALGMDQNQSLVSGK